MHNTIAHLDDKRGQFMLNLFFGRMACRALIGGALLLLLVGCVTSDNETTTQITNTDNSGEDATNKLNSLFQHIYDANLQRDPMTRESRGGEGTYSGWNDLSQHYASDSVALFEKQLETLGSFKERGHLSTKDRVSLELMEYSLRQSVRDFEYRNQTYNVTQMYGDHINPINQLLNIHKIENVTGAQAYIQRLKSLPNYLAQIEASLRESEKFGVIAPKFALEGANAQIEGILTGKPLQEDAANDSILLANFSGKVAALQLDKSVQSELNERVKEALVGAVSPAYRSLQKELVRLSKKAEVKGVWALPQGAAYYDHLLKSYTTTDLSADEIHELGHQEVVRIHGEMEAIMQRLNYAGDLQSFFKYTSSDEQFLFAKGEEGRVEAVAMAKKDIAHASQLLSTVITSTPSTDVVVKSVEKFREATSPAAFYQPGTADGSRPGVYYVNTYNREEIPTWQLPAITFHEAMPGHHLQVSIAQEREDLPTFRRFLYFTGHSEGWGLYSELLAKEMGLYEGLYEDYGRLVMDLLRACRLVADTGIHHKQWSEQQAVEFLLENMPISRDRALRSVRRYFVLPGQATAYKVGMIKLLELRQKAKELLGDKFDLLEFHEVILDQGMLPFSLLEELVNEWIANKK